MEREILPQYYRIEKDIIEKIRIGEWQVDDQIPTEIELVEMHKVSRPTIRHAISGLVQDGFLLRVRGKGTYVARPLITKDARIFYTFAEDMYQQGIVHESKTIKRLQIEASPTIAKHLMIPVNEDIYEITRLRIGNGENLVLRTSYFSKSRFPGLLDKNLDQKALDDILNQEYGCVPSSTIQYSPSGQFEQLKWKKISLRSNLEPPLCCGKALFTTTVGSPLN